MLKADVNEIGQFIPLHYHFQMLSDKDRMNSFRTAIQQSVKPGFKVAELGSGTGVMSSFAAKQGAEVWSVEFNPSLVSASRQFMKENGLSNRVHISQGDATCWLPPEPVDVVICEMLHSALLREKQIHVISAFRDNHMKRFGTIPQFIPCATLLGIQPVWQNYEFEGFYAPVPLFQSAYHIAADCNECGDPIVYKIIDYDNANVETYVADISFPFPQVTNVNALRFITKSLLTMDLTTGKTVDWHNQHLIMPLDQPIELQAGQTMRVRFSYRAGDPIETLHNSLQVEIIANVPSKKPLPLSA